MMPYYSLIGSGTNQANTMTTDRIINSLKPGQSAKISGDDKTWVQVERSGNGKTLRFVRCTVRTSEVFKTCAF